MTAARATRRRARQQRPQASRRGDPHHPQSCQAPADGLAGDHANRHSHHPQGRPSPAKTPEGGRSGLDDGCEHEACEHKLRRRGGECCRVPKPPAGALRPLARALLSVAAEAHSARCEVRRATSSSRHESTLRMGEEAVRSPVRLPVRLGLVSPATPEQTGGSDASSHVDGAPPPPVENPDCIGDCA